MNPLFNALDTQHKLLFALNARATRVGAPIFAGIDPVEKERRRDKGKRQRAARKGGR